jgi:hypothetical protein
MIKAILFMAVGAYGMYMYQQPGQVDGIVYNLKSTINESASDIYQATK